MEKENGKRQSQIQETPRVSSVQRDPRRRSRRPPMAESLQNRGERGLKMEAGGPYSYTRPFSQWSSIQLHARTKGTEVSEMEEDPSSGGPLWKWAGKRICRLDRA